MIYHTNCLMNDVFDIENKELQEEGGKQMKGDNTPKTWTAITQSDFSGSYSDNDKAY